MAFRFFLAPLLTMFTMSARFSSASWRINSMLRQRNVSSTAALFPSWGFSTGAIEMDKQKVRAVVDWPQPTTRREMQRFLGFSNFYRRFIRNYSGLAAPLTALTSTSVQFVWSPAAERAFQDLKRRFTSAPILTQPDPNRQFIVEVGQMWVLEPFFPSVQPRKNWKK